MAKFSFKRVLLYLVIILVAINFMRFISPKIIFKPQGVFLPTEAFAGPKIPVKAVKILPTDPNTEKYKTLGKINIEMRNEYNDPAIEKKIIDKAKYLAGENGANAIIIQAFGHTTTKGSQPGDQLYILHAKAVVNHDYD